MANKFIDPTTGRYRSPNFEEAQELFWSKVDRRGDSECWLWTSPPGSRGYGQFVVKGLPFKSGLAHRWAYYFAHGEVPGEVSHRCNVPLCCNPNHLQSGTHLENEQHKDASGRRPVGVKNLPCPHCGGVQEGRSRRQGANGVVREFAYCKPCKKRRERERVKRKREALLGVK